MDVFISLVIFGVGLFLYFITNNKIKGIKGNIIIEDTRKEIHSLITEFNSAAARNIELIESKISELQEMLKKANNKMEQLDEKIGRANKPFIIEKIVEKKSSMDHPDNEKKTLIRKNKIETLENESKSDLIHKENEKKENVPEPAVELSRSEQLKKLLNEGRTKQELMALGFMENEINLLSFLIRKSG